MTTQKIIMLELAFIATVLLVINWRIDNIQDLLTHFLK